jgi:hypothetical protein
MGGAEGIVNDFNGILIENNEVGQLKDAMVYMSNNIESTTQD